MSFFEVMTFEDSFSFSVVLILITVTIIPVIKITRKRIIILRKFFTL